MKAFKKLASSVVPLSTSSQPPPTLLVVDGDTYDDTWEAHLHADAHEEGGLGFADKEQLERQRGAVVEVVKQLGSNLLTGNFDLLKMSLPIKLFEPRSYLQKLADPWVYPRFLRLAAEADDPVERMRWVVCWFIAGLHHVFERWAKPFNPILGETWQATLPDSSQIFLEQTSHHPPVSAFELVGPDGLYVFSGLSQPAVSYKTNAVKTTAKGYRAITFRDGTKISIQYPAYYLKGLLYTSMPRAEIQGEAQFDDEANGLHATIRFGKVERTCSALLSRPDAFSGVLYEDISPSVAGSYQQPHQSTAAIPRHTSRGGGLSGKVSRSFSVRTSKSAPALDSEPPFRTPVATCTGNWLSHLDWDGERYWTLSEDVPEQWVPVPTPLPSDCRFREDLVLLQEGEIKVGQQAKEMLENRQRADAKLRKAGNAE